MTTTTPTASEMQQHLDSLLAGRLAISAGELADLLGLTRSAVRERIARGNLDVDVVSLGGPTSGVMVTVASVYRLFGCSPTGDAA